MRPENTQLAISIKHILTEGEWLTGEAISEYMRLIADQRNGAATLDPLVLTIYRESKGNKDLIENFTKRTNLTDKRILIAPLNKCSHWILLVAWLVKKELVIYDSLKKLTSCREDCRNLIEIIGLLDSNLGDKKSWTIKEFEAPQQNNSYDCGAFMLSFAEYVSRGAEIDFSQEDINCFRYQLGKQIYKEKVSKLEKNKEGRLYTRAGPTELDFPRTRHLSKLKQSSSTTNTITTTTSIHTPSTSSSTSSTTSTSTLKRKNTTTLATQTNPSKQDSYPFKYPRVRSLEPGSEDKFLEPIISTSVQGGFARNAGPSEEYPLMNCPHDKLEENIISCIVNHNPTRLLSLFIVFKSLGSGLKVNQAARWVDIRIAEKLEPKWKLFDYLRSIYLFDCYRWVHIERRAEKQGYDIEKFISEECKLALIEYNKSIKRYTSSRQYARDLKLSKQKSKKEFNNKRD